MKKANKIVFWLLGKMFPLKCPLCNRITTEGICDLCKEEYPRIGFSFCMKCGRPLRYEEEEYCKICNKVKPPFEQGRSLWSGEGKVLHALYRFKYNNCRCYGRAFAKVIYEEGLFVIKRWDVEQIIPVPLSKGRKKKRGFNQAEILAKELSQLTGIELNTTALLRCKETKPQKKLTPYERQRNLQNAFLVKGSKELKARVLLIDDIYTTGATIAEATRVLKDAGVQSVFFFTICTGMQY